MTHPDPSTALALRPPQHQVDPRCRPWWAVQILLTAGIPAIVLLVLGLIFDGLWFWLSAALLAAVPSAAP